MYVLVDANGIVQNTIVWDGVSGYTPATGFVVLQAPDGTVMGATYASGTFTNPTVTPPAPSVPPLSSAQILADALVAKGLISQTDINTVATENGVTFFQSEPTGT